jgi:hypothetical protein
VCRSEARQRLGPAQAVRGFPESGESFRRGAERAVGGDGDGVRPRRSSGGARAGSFARRLTENVIASWSDPTGISSAGAADMVTHGARISW